MSVRTSFVLALLVGAVISALGVTFGWSGPSAWIASSLCGLMLGLKTRRP